ncbi:hypothetical protein B0H14DRAFT_2937548, partial [Mycena olivaceomarginata]
MQFKQILSSLLILGSLAAAAPPIPRSKQIDKFSYDKAVREFEVEDHYGKRTDFEGCHSVEGTISTDEKRQCDPICLPRVLLL